MAPKRSIYLINDQFQLKFSIFVCLIAFLSSLIYPLAIYELIDIIARKYGDLLEIKSLSQIRTRTFIFLSIYQLIYLTIVFLVCVFQSHKIAGPIYKIRKHLNYIKKGRPFEKIYLRKGDNFQELADDINDAFENLQITFLNYATYIQEIKTYLNNVSLVVPEDKKIILLEINHKLSEIHEKISEQ